MANSTQMTRRKFVGVSVAAAGAAAAAGLAGCDSGGSGGESTAEESKTGMADGMFADCETCYAVHSPECQHHLLKGYVRDGKLVYVEPAEQNSGHPCLRGLASVDTANSSKRLTKPLKLVGEKGSGDFQEIEWDEAIDLIEEKINAALDDGGPGSLMHVSGTGNLGPIWLGITGTFPTWFGGQTPTAGNMCCAGIDAGVATVLGARMQPIHNQLANADYIICWGNNPVVSLGGYWDRFQTVMDNGGTVCTVDPYQTETADKSQEWIRPWPGTDSAVTLAMLKVIIDEKLYKEDFLLEHTTAACLLDRATGMPYYQKEGDDTSLMVYDAKAGKVVALADLDASSQPALVLDGTDAAADYMTQFEAVKAEADKWDKEAVEAETSVSHDDIARIARDYANAGKAIIIQNMGGYQRTENGAYATALQVYLALFCGQIGREGTGIYDACGSANIVPAGTPFEANPDAQTFDPIPIPAFADNILADQPRKIDFLWVTTANPVAQWPNSNSVKQAFEHIPFVVSTNITMSSTGLWSDLVLPASTIFEHEDVTHGIRSPQISVGEAKVTPPGEAKSDLEIFELVAERFGFQDKYNQDMGVYIDRVLEGSGVTQDELKEKKGIDAFELNPDFIAYKDGNFPTSTGRATFFVQSWVDEGYPGIACHQRPEEHPLNDTELSAKYPLAALQRKTRTEVHTSYKWMDSMLAIDGSKPNIIMNPADAESRGIADGDSVVAFNDRGEHAGRAMVTERCKQGTVMLENGWDDTTASSSSNVTSNKWPTLGTMHCCNSTLVDVKKGE